MTSTARSAFEPRAQTTRAPEPSRLGRLEAPATTVVQQPNVSAKSPQRPALKAASPSSDSAPKAPPSSGGLASAGLASAGVVSALSRSGGDTYTTGEMARLSKNTLRTVRFYEEAGILHPIGRTEGGHRVFEKSQLERLLWITDMREAGMSLEQIRDLLDMKQKAASGGDAARKATEALRVHIEELRSKIDVLARLSDDLAQTIEAANACLACEDATLFPKQCGECGRLNANGPVPRAMRVLWGVRDTKSGGS